MSLIICLEDPTATYEIDSLCELRITHNLAGMAFKAGIYDVLWNGDGKYAEDIVSVVKKGLDNLESQPEYFKNFNSPNGWGAYENFVKFVKMYVIELEKFPLARISVY
jgi:hypothetical protein